MKKVWNWLVYSSADPTKISLTLKSVGPFVIAILALFKFDISSEVWEQLVAEIVAAISGVTLLIGLVRKISSLIRTILDSRK